MPIDVSVVVPVYNPGVYLTPLLDALDRQTIGWERMEAIFVDDGSTDDTSQRLDSWVATRPNVTVVHQPNHGWPGQPRNVGIGLARGEYIQFVDQDDWLGDTALADLHAFARTNESDVVIGKMVGVSRGVPSGLFGRTVPRVELGREPVQDSQTPHKMLRRAFLYEIGLRFPEGRRRLEDHVFMTTAYLKAQAISIYADTDCYFHIGRSDGGNAGYRAYDPAEYYRAVDEVLDIVDSLLPAGKVHDVYADRWLRIELAARLHTHRVRTLPRARRNAFYREIARVIRSRYPLEAIRASRPQTRVTAAVVRLATPQEFWRFDRAVTETSVHVWREGTQMRVRLFVDGRERPATARLSDLLQAAVPRIAEQVLTDLQDDPALVAEPVASAAVGKTVAIRTPIGVRRTVVDSQRQRSRHVEWGVDRLSARGRVAARRLLGSRADMFAEWRRRLSRH